MRNALVVGGLVLVLGVANYAIVEKERVLASGTPMLVELAPVDPRSLIQGDYMRLDYALARELRETRVSRDGRMVVSLDSGGVARFVRLHDGRAPLAPGERLLQYRKRGSRIRVGTDALANGDAGQVSLSHLYSPV